MQLLWQVLLFPQSNTQIMTLTLTESWIPTRSVILLKLIKTLPQTRTWKKTKEDTQIHATLFKHIPACINAADIELLLEDIPVQPLVVILDRSMQEAVQAKD
jgi:hypothetical protein